MRQGVQTAASKPPPFSGALPPMVTGMTPAIGPPSAAEAGVSLVWFAPAFAGAGVHPQWCDAVHVRGRGCYRDQNESDCSHNGADGQANVRHDSSGEGHL